MEEKNNNLEIEENKKKSRFQFKNIVLGIFLIILVVIAIILLIFPAFLTYLFMGFAGIISCFIYSPIFTVIYFGSLIAWIVLSKKHTKKLINGGTSNQFEEFKSIKIIVNWIFVIVLVCSLCIIITFIRPISLM